MEPGAGLRYDQCIQPNQILRTRRHIEAQATQKHLKHRGFPNLLPFALRLRWKVPGGSALSKNPSPPPHPRRQTGELHGSLVPVGGGGSGSGSSAE